MSNAVSTLSCRNVFGLNKQCTPNVLFVGDEFIVFSAGNTIVSHNINSRQQRIFVPTEDDPSGVSAIAYAEGKPNVAFGNSDISPGVCIFDIHSQHPLNFLHLSDDFNSQGGFISLSFSNDGHYLLGHGKAPGWNLVVWSLESNQRVDMVKTAEKETPVTMCTFSPGKNPQIAVTGNNILKIYKLENGKLREVVIPNPKIGNIMCHLWLNETTLLCANSSGDIISVTSDPQQSVIESCDHRDSPFVTMARYKKGFLAASEGGYLTKFDQSTTTPGKYVQVEQVKLFGDELPISAHTIAVDPSEENCAVSLRNNRIVTVSLSNGDIILNPEEKPLIMPFHDGPIFSCSTCCRKPLIATCGADKTVRVWNYLDNSLEICKEFTESVYCVSFHPDGLSMLIGLGDKLGLFGVFYDDLRKYRDFPIRGCRCAKFSNGGQLFAAVNLSKIQIYSTLTFQLINTLHKHSTIVNNLIWGEADTIIASVGADGAMYVHRQESSSSKSEENYTTSGIQYSAITASPDFTSIYISGTDCMIKEIQNGSVVRTQNYPQCENSPHQQKALVMSNNGQMFFSGSKDGKVTSFSLPINNEKSEICCHTGEINSMAISFDDSLLFSVGDDGVLAIFTIHDKDNRVHTLERTFFSDEVLTTKAEIEEKAGQLRTSEAELVDLDVNFKMKKDMAESTNKQNVQAENERIKKAKEKWRINNENMKKKKDETDMMNKAEDKRINKEWNDKIAAKDDYYMQEILKMHKECENLANQKKEIETQGKNNLAGEEANFKRIMENMQGLQRSKLEEAQVALETAKEEKRAEEQYIEEMKKEILEENKTAIKDTETTLDKTKEENEKHRSDLQDECQSRSKDFNSYQKQMEHHTAEQEKLKTLMMKLEAELKSLNEENRQLEAEITQRNQQIKERETKIGEVKKENQELEKYHAVLTHQENMLRQQSTPLESSIAEKEKRISEMDAELENAHKDTSEKNESIVEMQQKLQKVIESERRQTKLLTSARSYFEQMKHDLHEVVQKFHAKDELKSMFLAFYQKFIQNEKIEDIQLDEAVEEEHKRQTATLQKQLKELRQQQMRDSQFQIKEEAKDLHTNASLIEELEGLRQEHKQLLSSMALTKKATGAGQKGQQQMLPATEANRRIEENKKKIAALEQQLKQYNDSRPST
ncbi:hypothetical protein TVAG_214090 [Trichomonas vaginalis G3]|uniref:Uncharacterized protein n=1 Tax=Trichomonas vaginalis (strain ATCC PRA-98 / G3) TaxID=412133 RepID=A2DK13_TRIV3|nr:cilia- and flagella-associated protein 57 family [Trichomonas vaginalis G3]EAY19184.1 hypothetical protein TVAG_214090 [Trichomonas vaginalis G3]KAI5548468.1 cilia- and flagella-associated protein 57 family [Trichomonas vaginalis G3]|eukprot:XP_001580170.1 hypothetical protein [Trichomonas vaginalis G3]